jgi:hypothetical protein
MFGMCVAGKMVFTSKICGVESKIKISKNQCLNPVKNHDNRMKKIRWEEGKNFHIFNIFNTPPFSHSHSHHIEMGIRDGWKSGGWRHSWLKKFSILMTLAQEWKIHLRLQRNDEALFDTSSTLNAAPIWMRMGNYGVKGDLIRRKIRSFEIWFDLFAFSIKRKTNYFLTDCYAMPCHFSLLVYRIVHKQQKKKTFNYSNSTSHISHLKFKITEKLFLPLSEFDSRWKKRWETKSVSRKLFFISPRISLLLLRANKFELVSFTPRIS